MFKKLLLISLTVANLSAIVYEDAEDLNSKRWISVVPKYKGKITNIFDKKRVSRVIQFSGNGTKSIYRLPIPSTLENLQIESSSFSWEMNYSEDFVILIVLDTIKGKRHLIYTPDMRNSYLQYGLGSKGKGKWQKYSREKDLQLYEKENKIILIKDFIIKGSGLIDNIQLTSLKKKLSPPVVKEVVKKNPKKPKHNYWNDTVPVLKIKGKNPLILKVGEEYVEAGATAKNRDGSDIDIKITDNIDILTEGEYTVIYFATNKLGNSSIDKRQVIVGKIRNKKSEKKSNEHEDRSARCEEVPNFFKEKFKEKELVKKEKLIDDERPERPGL